MIQTDTSYQTNNSSERPTSLVSRFGSSGFHKPMSPSMEVSLFSRRQKLIQKRAQVFKSMENLSYDPDRDSSDRDTDGVCSRFALQSPAATTHNYHANSKDYYSRSTAFPSAAAEVASHPSKDGAAAEGDSCVRDCDGSSSSDKYSHSRSSTDLRFASNPMSVQCNADAENSNTRCSNTRPTPVAADVPMSIVDQVCSLSEMYVK